MLEQFTYKNNFGDTLEFGNGNLFVNENDLRDFSWDITSKNNRISGFKMGIVSKTIPVILKCDTESEGVQLRNRLFEVFEKDVLARQPGKLFIGGYYLRCYITGSKKTQYLNHKDYMEVSLTVQTDRPEWVKETSMSVYLVPRTESYFDYPCDYSHDYIFKDKVATTGNASFVPSNFVMELQGNIYAPTLYINNHKYCVNVTINDGEVLTINSAEKTIVLTKANGEQVNCFNHRAKDSYIFEKIPSGALRIVTDQLNLNAKITLLEERSEPKWT